MTNQFGMFRGIDNSTKKVVYGAFIQFTKQVGFIIDFDGEQRFPEHLIYNETAAACTTLKDKNGIPIYGSFPLADGTMTKGGDICKIPDWEAIYNKHKPFGKIKSDDSRCDVFRDVSVIYEYGAFWIKDKNSNSEYQEEDELYCNNTTKNLEIIGSQYEQYEANNDN